MRRDLVPALVAALSLLAMAASTLWLHAVGARVLAHALEARLDGVGRTAALWLGPVPPTRAQLEALRFENQLEGAQVIGPGLMVLADARGEDGRRVDLLRTDAERVQRALAGDPSVGFAYAFGEVPVGAGYFPVFDAAGQVQAVLVLEAGDTFSPEAPVLDRARTWTLALTAQLAVLVGLLVWRWTKAEQARRQGELARTADRVLAQVAAMAAHEIRNPLGIIQGTVERLRARSGANLMPRDHAALDDINGEVARLNRLTCDLLDLARQRALSFGPVDLRALAGDVTRAAAAGAPGFRAELVPGGPAAVEGDADRLRQVLLNLLLNAAQAGPRVTARVTVEAAPGGAWVRVADDGPGLPPEVRARLFEPFASGKAQGTGLGLALSRVLVERHGGRLDLEPSPAGTAFGIWLPSTPPAP